jgi:hypothetical protein
VVEKSKPTLSEYIMHKSILAIAFTVLIVGSATCAESSSEWDRGSQYNQMFNPKSIETVKGVVTEITDFQLANGEKGVLLKLESDAGVLAVHLGPAWFLNNQGIKLETGDKVTVKGSQIEYQNGSALIAQAVVKQNHMLVLRSAAGVPAWSAWTTL